ncbi:MAG TPA: hypothetical protein PKW76_12140 [bacterium]|nr:hypothetical protein [bacterium]HPG46423.1 hypothetical protein [bacterium]HPM98664.1 hypothetical protein [bacterium]
MRNRSVDAKHRLVETIRWIARVWSVLSIGMILLFFIGEGFDPVRIEAEEWLGLFFSPFAVCAGMIIAWQKEILGGTIAVAGLGFFYLLNLLTVGRFPSGWFFLLFSLPGLLFLACGLQSRRTTLFLPEKRRQYN